ncbi:MAG: ketopantoate reductase family protein [Candidatus Izimaplasma sp.]|nr:ketopantoate reductase family protein [Candidatus Izimaplasma bacterium]
MNVAIYGAGAMGTVLGAYITKAGHKIDLINRNKAHVKALKHSGAKIIGTTEFTQKVTALLPNEMTKTYDIILLMTKQRHNEEIIKFLLAYLADDGVICTMQNGIPELKIASIIGKDRTIGCTMSWGATFHGGGVSELTSEPTNDTLSFNIGKFGAVDDDKFMFLVSLLKTMGTVSIEDNFLGFRWAKLLVNSAFSGLSVVTGETFGYITKHYKTRKIALMIIKECILVAKAANIEIEPIQGKDIVKLMDYTNKLSYLFSFFILPLAMKKHKNIRSSMLRDLKKGRKTEIDFINGIVVDYGKKVNVTTPLNDKILEITHKIEKNQLSPSTKNIVLFNELI